MKKLLLLVLSFSFWSPSVIGQEENLEVEGAIQIGNSENPTPEAGTIRWTGTDFEGWNGTCWLSLTGGISCSVITDEDGNTYESVIIGTQEWLTTDLRTTKCNDGTPIPLVTDNTAWENLNTGAYCWYNNDETTQIENGYGALYNWYVINECNICPTGWHVPTDTEWTILIDYLGGEMIAGGKLREVGLGHWYAPNIDATNESGWTGLPGGFRYAISGIFWFIPFNGYWWSSTESSDNAWFFNLVYNGANTNMILDSKRSGCSVRCLKD